MVTDEQLQKDPTISKALALDYLTLDDLKSGRGLSLVLEKHAQLVLAGLPVKGDEVKAAIAKLNEESELATAAEARLEELVRDADPEVQKVELTRQIGNAKQRLGLAEKEVDEETQWEQARHAWMTSKMVADANTRLEKLRAKVTSEQSILDGLTAKLAAVDGDTPGDPPDQANGKASGDASEKTPSS